MRNILLSLTVGLSLALTGCSTKHHGKVKKSEVKLSSKSGSAVKGTLHLEDHYGGVIITGKLSGLKPGLHGFHIHQNGDCKSWDANSVGGHFVVAGAAKDSHHGDLGNIEAKPDGTANVNIHVKGLKLGAGDNSIADKSIVVHAEADDAKVHTDGNTSKKIACGVIKVKAFSCGDCGDCGKDGCKGGCEGGCKSKFKCDNCKDGNCKCKDNCKCEKCGCTKCSGKKKSKE